MNAANHDGPSARRLKEISSLKRSKGRRSLGQTLVEGPRLLASAVAGGAAIVEVLLDNLQSLPAGTGNAIARIGIPVHVVGRQAVERISAVQTSQGVIGVVGIRAEEPDALFESGPVLVLDEVQDPGNVGTLIRSASWFGFEAVVAGPGTADLWSPKVVRSAMGGTWATRLFQADDVVHAVSGLKASGHEIAVLATDGESIEDWIPGPRVALVIGSEARGVAPATASVADRRLRIGGTGNPAVESLNASIAGAIAMFKVAANMGKIDRGGMH